MRVIKLKRGSKYESLSPAYVTEYPILIANLAWINIIQYQYSLLYSSVGSTRPDTEYANIIQKADTYLAVKALGRQELLETDLPLNAHDSRSVNDIIREYRGAETRDDWSLVSIPLSIFAYMQKFEQFPDLKRRLRKLFVENENTYLRLLGENSTSSSIITALGYFYVYSSCEDMSLELAQKINLFTPTTGTYTWYSSNGIRRTTDYINGSIDGWSRLYRSNGELYEETPYKKGLKHGIYRKYKNGKVIEEYEWENGNMIITRKETYPDGSPYRETKWSLDGQTGLEKVWFPSGVLQASVMFKGGDRHGTSTSYYENKQIRSQGEFKNGQRTGHYKLYSEDGRLISDTSWKNGKKNGMSLKWDSNGVQIKNELWQNGVKKADQPINMTKSMKCSSCDKDVLLTSLDAQETMCPECLADMNQINEELAANPTIYENKQAPVSPTKTTKKRTSTYSVYLKVMADEWNESMPHSNTKPPGGIMRYAASLWKDSFMNPNSSAYNEEETAKIMEEYA